VLVRLALGVTGLVLAIVIGVLIAEPQVPAPDQAVFPREASGGT